MITKKSKDFIIWCKSTIKKLGMRSPRPGLVLGVMLTVLLILGVATSFVVAKEKTVPLQDKSRPFKASASGTFSPMGPEEGNFFTVTDAATGRANGFGEFTFAHLVLQNSSILPEDCVSGVGNTTVQGSGMLVFADGALFLEPTDGQACVDFSEEPPVVTFVETNKIAGGTGRFNEAEGKLKIEITGNLSDHTTGITFSGHINW